MNKLIAGVLKEQEKLNKNEKYSCINHETGELLNLLVQLKQPKNVLEIGTSIGYSGVWIASALPKNGKLITIDKWKERAEIAWRFFRKSGLRITQIEGDAVQILPKLNQRFDAVFIDAQKSQYFKYLQLLMKNKLLNKNAVIIADNVVSHADKMQDFLEFAKKHDAVIFNVGKGISVFIM